MPSALVPGEEATVFLRVPRPFPRVKVSLGGVISRNHLGARPAEMIELKVPPDASEELSRMPEVRVEVTPA
ncbi:hypothetical protein H5T52_11195 [Candidatus Bipolaricaulota bacterium]|nr:hypothetical protein [Candidatus Bipolaricaulota bacterium]